MEDRLAVIENQLDDMRVISDADQLKPTQKQTLLAYCVATSMSLSLAGNDDTVTEAVVADLRIDFPAWWRPSDNNYFRRLKLTQLIAHGKAPFGAKWVKEHGASTKKKLVAVLSVFFNGKPVPSMEDKLKQIRSGWLPDGFATKAKTTKQ